MNTSVIPGKMTKKRKPTRRESGEKLETKNIVHRALAKIGFAG
jgi:hypothetical protein